MGEKSSIGVKTISLYRILCIDFFIFIEYNYSIKEMEA